MILPTEKDKLADWALDVINHCRASQSRRASLCRVLNQWIETGRPDGQRSIINKLFAHTDRLSAHLFSPTDLRFSIDFEMQYAPEILAQAEMAGRALTREWKRKSFDMAFGVGVGVATHFGASLIKQTQGSRGTIFNHVMPWQFGVYREDQNGLENQEAMVESSYMTIHEAWRRISHMPGADKLLERIVTSARPGTSGDIANSFFHQVISTATLNTDLSGSTRIQPGGVVQLSNDPGLQIMGPEVTAECVQYHELWVVDEATDDYTTIQIIEPDIIIAPYLRNKNLFVPKRTPYTLIQPNTTPGYFWGRSEVTDLTEPQQLLTDWMDDIRRVMGSQYDKLLAFANGDGITDEKYAQFRSSGYIDLGAGASVNDVTPKLPAEAFQGIQLIQQFMDEISGFGGVLSGQGESGVRAGVHADTLMKTGSPRLRDRSLLIERQCAECADNTLALMQLTSDKKYTAFRGDQPVEFILYDLPPDRQVMVDSHSSSPIYEDDHKDLVSFGLKAGIVDGESAIEMLPFPKKDVLVDRWKQSQAAKAAQMQQLAAHDPHAAMKQMHKAG